MAASGKPPTAQADVPRRIVSINLCTDQLLLALADRSQIAAVSHNARDPEMSAAADAARGVPVVDASAEALLALNPDLVLGMPARGTPAMVALAAAGRYPPTLDVPHASSFADIYAGVRAVARAVGHVDRGEALIARMQRMLGAVGRPGGGRVVALYQRRGYLTGGGTLEDDVLQRMGFIDLATRLHRPALSHLTLEELVAARPAFLLVSAREGPGQDLGSAMLAHPALRAIPRLTVPDAWLVCGGPASAAAVARLAEQARP